MILLVYEWWFQLCTFAYNRLIVQYVQITLQTPEDDGEDVLYSDSDEEREHQLMKVRQYFTRNANQHSLLSDHSECLANA